MKRNWLSGAWRTWKGAPFRKGDFPGGTTPTRKKKKARENGPRVEGNGWSLSHITHTLTFCSRFLTPRAILFLSNRRARRDLSIAKRMLKRARWTKTHSTGGKMSHTTISSFLVNRPSPMRHVSLLSGITQQTLRQFTPPYCDVLTSPKKIPSGPTNLGADRRPCLPWWSFRLSFYFSNYY